MQNSNNKEASPVAKGDAESDTVVPQPCAIPGVSKLRKPSFFAKFGFRPKGPNSKNMEGQHKKDKAQKKSRGSSETQDSSKSNKDKGSKDKKTDSKKKLK